MLDYFKTILSKVSFNAELFEKELRKAIKSLTSTDLEEFRDWCYEQFGHQYPQLLNYNFV